MTNRKLALTATLLCLSNSSLAQGSLPTIGKWEHGTYSTGHDIVESTQTAKVEPKPNNMMKGEHADYILYSAKFVEQSKPSFPVFVISAVYMEDKLVGEDKFFDNIEASNGQLEIDKDQGSVLLVNDKKVSVNRTFLSPHQAIFHPKTLAGMSYIMTELIEGRDLVIKGKNFGDYKIEADGFKTQLEIDESAEVL
ncbi:hypothetical protein [Vibrio breoganii]|uniref:hypothetical protein n=1 Tax=Vibrio breoganii TaxID=553239 RepID=UPI000C865E49|nr:hypothetical protein [Vibrio breoganii]PMK20452.1 hypothetical protein BCU06_06685 [Vibrio breoganii]